MFLCIFIYSKYIQTRNTMSTRAFDKLFVYNNIARTRAPHYVKHVTLPKCMLQLQNCNGTATFCLRFYRLRVDSNWQQQQENIHKRTDESSGLARNTRQTNLADTLHVGGRLVPNDRTRRRGSTCASAFLHTRISSVLHVSQEEQRYLRE